MTSRQYWKRRSLLLEQLIRRRADDTIIRISGFYNRAQEEILSQLEAIFATFKRESGLTQEQALSLLSVRETDEARQRLRQIYENSTGTVKQDAWARLAAPAYANRISRLQALRDWTYLQARLVGLDEVQLITDRLEDALQQSYYRTIFDVQHETGEYFDFNRLTDNQMRAAIATNWSGENWSSRIWNNNQAFADAVQQTVTVGLMSGQSYDTMRDQLLAEIGMTTSQGAQYKGSKAGAD